MANQSLKNNKMLIGGLCLAVVAVIVAVVAIVLVNNNKLNDSYFVSDGTKYVLTIDNDNQDDASDPIKTHVVYTYSGDTITGMKTYAVYADDASAKKAYDEYVATDATPEELSRYELNGKYVILSAEENEYKDLTAADVKQQIEFIEMLKKMSNETDDSTEIEDIEETEIEESNYNLIEQN